jgi:selenocysteine-specific elongation factor
MSPTGVEPSPLVPVIIGTAGHIDHGKSSLVKALTGTDPDRLKEEKSRGITIELGYAFLSDRVAFIDVPGHERFVRQMVAGAATVDYGLLVVAADDGVMPQTREHLDILSLLDVKGGLVVITKADLAEEDLVALVREDVGEALRGSALDGAPILVADSLSRRGLDEVRAAILALAASKRPTTRGDIFRLPVDRVFTVKGFGTVATGSVLSGSVRTRDTLRLLPAGRDVRVRGIQSHDVTIDQAVAGQRAALNLTGVSVDELARGDVLVTPDTLEGTRRLAVKLSVLPDSPRLIQHRQRVHVHLGTADLLARVRLLEDEPVLPGGEGLAELMLEAPTAAQRHDRFVIRQYSPLVTIGGGVVIDPGIARLPRRRVEARAALARLADWEPSRALAATLEQRLLATVEELAVALSRPEAELQEELDALHAAGEALVFGAGSARRYAPPSLLSRITSAALEELSRFHEKNPLRAGMARAELASRLQRQAPKGAAPLLIAAAIERGLLGAPSSEHVALPGFRVEMTRRQQKNVDAMLARLEGDALKPSSVDDLAALIDAKPRDTRVLLTWLVDTGRLVCLDKTLFFTAESVMAARRGLAELFARQPSATLSEIREHLDTSRKYAVPLMEHFDGRGWTRRDGDVRSAGASRRPDEP